MKQRNDWIKGNGKLTMGKHPCIRHKINMNYLFPKLKAEYEHTLASYNGEIWQNNENTYKAIIHTSTAQKKARQAGFYTGDFIFNQGDEMLVCFDKSRLDEMVQLLNITNQRGRQVTYANSFSRKA